MQECERDYNAALQEMTPERAHEVSLRQPLGAGI